MNESNSLRKTQFAQDYEWTNPVQTTAFQEHNIYTLGINKGEQEIQWFKKVYKSVNVSKNSFESRRKKLQQFQHQNYVAVLYKQVKYQNVQNYQFVKQFSVISPYIQSISIQNLIKQKVQLCHRSFLTVVEQVVNLMAHAEFHQIFHYRLNSNSILLVKNDFESSPQFFVKICDWGYGNEVFSVKNYKKQIKFKEYLQNFSKTSMFQYVHPQILLKQNNEQSYTKFKSQYDIWSFGVILYRLRCMSRPFSKNGVFYPQILKQHYQKDKHVQIQKHWQLDYLIQNMLKPHGYESWIQIKQFLINRAQLNEIDFLGIDQIYLSFYYFMNYLINIYKLIVWSISNSANCFWYENKYIMKKCAHHLLKLMYLLQKVKFLQRFHHRMQQLPEHQNQTYKSILKLLQSQWIKITQKQTYLLQSMDFFENLEKLREYLVPIEIRIVNYDSIESITEKSSLGARIRQTWKSMKTIKNFSSQMLKAINQMQNRNKNVFQCFYGVLNSNY